MATQKKTANDFTSVIEASNELVGKIYADVKDSFCIRDISSVYTEDRRPYRINVLVKDGVISSVQGFF